MKEILPAELAKLEKLLATRAGGKKFILGDKVGTQIISIYSFFFERLRDD